MDVYSTVDTPQTAVLRDGKTSKVLVALAKQDISQLLAAGWKPPMREELKAHEGKAKVYGFVFKPTDFDAGRSIR